MDLTEIKSQIKRRLSLGLNYGFQSLEELLLPDSLLHDEFIGFKSQYNDLNRIAGQGILPYEQIEIGYNKIRASLLDLIGRLSSSALIQQEELPSLQNNELQHRKQNFFELLKIHLANLNEFELKMQFHYGNETKVDVHAGRMGFRYLYYELFKYNFLNPAGGEKVEIISFTQKFFTNRYPQLEIYAKTLKFILEYIDREEIDQDFFYGIMRSILSSSEIVVMVYFCIGGLAPGLAPLMRKAGMASGEVEGILIEEEHWGEFLGLAGD